MCTNCFRTEEVLFKDNESKKGSIHNSFCMHKHRTVVVFSAGPYSTMVKSLVYGCQLVKFGDELTLPFWSLHEMFWDETKHFQVASLVKCILHKKMDDWVVEQCTAHMRMERWATVLFYSWKIVFKLAFLCARSPTTAFLCVFDFAYLLKLTQFPEVFCQIYLPNS